jgi:hypothetical protein
MKGILRAAVCAALFGCGSSEPTLSPAEMQALTENLSECEAAHREASRLALEIALGEADLSGYVYTPPTAENGWVGTIVGNDVTLDAGTGDLFVTFAVTGDNGPTDPYLEDLSDDAAVVVHAVVSFLGTSGLGLPISMNADFVLSTFAAGSGARGFELDGTFDFAHGAYAANFIATNFSMLLDELTREAVEVTGALAARIDLPDYDFDADFLLQGFGTRVEATLRAGGSFLHYAIDLLDL